MSSLVSYKDTLPKFLIIHKEEPENIAKKDGAHVSATQLWLLAAKRGKHLPKFMQIRTQPGEPLQARSDR